MTTPSYDHQFAATAREIVHGKRVSRRAIIEAIARWLDQYEQGASHLTPDQETHRSAITGQYVSDAEAEAAPDTTVTEHTHHGPRRCDAVNPRGAGCAFDFGHQGDHATSLGNSFTTT